MGAVAPLAGRRTHCAHPRAALRGRPQSLALPFLGVWHTEWVVVWCLCLIVSSLLPVYRSNAPFFFARVSFCPAAASPGSHGPLHACPVVIAPQPLLPLSPFLHCSSTRFFTDGLHSMRRLLYARVIATLVGAALPHPTGTVASRTAPAAD